MEKTSKGMGEYQDVMMATTRPKQERQHQNVKMKMEAEKIS
jgi:hypothetical protein